MNSIEFDFVIPLSIDGLQESASPRQYSVSHVSTIKELPQGIQECLRSFRKDGPKFILDQNCFDILYSVLVNFKNMEEEAQMIVWQLMIKVMTATTTTISNALDEESSYHDFGVLLLTLKMNTYIACTLTEAFESNYNKPVTDINLTGKKKKRGPKRSDLGVDWEEERTRMLVQLFSLIQPPLNRLWDPPVMDEDYVNLIANCCYKILETSSMNLIRTKAARDTIFQILGTLVKKFNHGLACSLKLMQLLQHFEHLVSPTAQGIVLMIETYDTKGVLQEMIREVIKMDAKEMSKDSSGLRNYAQFFVEVAERCPHVFIPYLSLLIAFLQQEAYCMRNCVLSILGSIVLRVLKGETLDSKSKALRDECLSYLQEFIHDCHAFVRSRVLQIWEELVGGQAVPLAQQQPILKMVVQRLRDKSSNVRKNALHLMAAFLKANPFAAKLPLEDLKTQFENEMKTLEELQPGISLDAEEEDEKDPTIEKLWNDLCPDIIKGLKKVIKEDSDMEDSEEEDEREEKAPSSDEETEEETPFSLPSDLSLNDGLSLIGEKLSQNKTEIAIQILRKVMDQHTQEEIFQVNLDEISAKSEDRRLGPLSESRKELFVILHRIFVSIKKMEKEKEQMSVDEEAEKNRKEMKKKEEEIMKQKTLCCYLRDSVSFAREIHRGLPDICQLLASRQTTDILEAIDFFVTAFEFGVLNAMSGVRKMLGLIWSKEQTVKDAVVNAYRRLYINIDAPNDRSRALVIVRNLTSLITGATLGELTSMEEIVAQFFKTGDINKHCITLLWERFTKTLPETSDEESKSSLILLSMAANSEVGIISSNLHVLIDVGLGERGNHDFCLVKNTCLALCKIAPVKLKTDDPHPPSRMDQDHTMFKRLVEILTNGIFNDKDNHYCPMAIEAINTIYLLSEHPDITCGKMIQDILQNIRQKDKAEDGADDERATRDPMGLNVSTLTLTRFLTIVGQVALRQLVHMDTFIFTELKRRNYLREEQKQNDKRRRLKRKSNVTSASEVSTSRLHDGDMDEEMGLTGAVADDMEAEFIRSICETDTVKGDNLLTLLRPLIVCVCANPTKYSDPYVRASAGLALAKFMLVSSECCEENLQLLFTILEKSKEPVIRGNTIIAIGDLTFRFPNLVEPWTPRIYARLRDQSTFVRRTTLTVLTHLILNDQVKVKGQISDIALCVTDEDARISGLAKLFFNELSKKGNSLYNVLPDIISRLSDTEIGTTEENFRSIISHIFGLIQKDRQLESFVEKLCYRLQATNVSRQWRDICYCLSLLPYSDKGIRKLSENFNCYCDKLHEQNVYELFVTILTNSKKNAKVETKTAIEELESKLEECHKKGVEDENVVTNAMNKKKPAKKGQRKSRRKSKDSESDSASDGSEEGSDQSEDVQLHPAHRDHKENIPPNIVSPRRRSTRSRKTLSPPPPAAVSDEESSSSDQEEDSETDGEDANSKEENLKEVVPRRKNTRIAPVPLAVNRKERRRK